MIKDNRIGWVIDNNQVESLPLILNDIYKNKNRLKSISKRCRDIVIKKYSQNIVLEKYKKLLITKNNF